MTEASTAIDIHPPSPVTCPPNTVPFRMVMEPVSVPARVKARPESWQSITAPFMSSTHEAEPETGEIPLPPNSAAHPVYIVLGGRVITSPSTTTSIRA